MNVLNWIQQEQKIADYHVVKWSTSHFHSQINKADHVGQVNIKPLDAVSIASDLQRSQEEGIGFGLVDHAKGQYKAGGLGTDGAAIDGSKDASDNRVMSTSQRTHGNQTTGSEAEAAVVQGLLPTEVYSVVESARQSVLKVGSRIRQSAVRLRDICQKQSEQTANTQKTKKPPRRQSKEEQRGTRHVTKDEVLFMQAENHYLLDSYDKNGQYSMLGK